MIKEIIMSKVSIKSDTGCWEWTAAKKRGTPYISIKKNFQSARRVSFEQFVGEIFDESICVTNSCKNILCVNPDHLLLKSKTEVAMEASKEKFSKIKKCKFGYNKSEFVPDNRGVKYCPNCARLRHRRRADKRKTCKNGHDIKDSIVQKNGARRCSKCVEEGVFHRRWASAVNSKE